MSRRRYPTFIAIALAVPATILVAGRFALYAIDQAVPPGTPPGLARAGTAAVVALAFVVGIGAVAHPKQ